MNKEFEVQHPICFKKLQSLWLEQNFTSQCHTHDTRQRILSCYKWMIIAFRPHSVYACRTMGNPCSKEESQEGDNGLCVVS